MNIRLGHIIVMTGNGKGKTTSAIGAIIRALNYNWKIALFQFMKNNNYIGEINFLKKNINTNLLSIFKYQLSNQYKIKENREKYINKILCNIENITLDNKTDLIVLDEINVALFYKLLPVNKIINIIQNKNKWKTIILTGRNANKKILNIANLISEIKKIKHPFDNNIKAQEGIEF